MPFIIQNTGISYTSLSNALNALPATFLEDFTINGDEDVALNASSGLVLPTKNTNGYRLTIAFDSTARRITNTATSSYLLQIGISNVTLKNVTLVSTNYTATNQRTVYLPSPISGLTLENVVFDGGYYALGHAALTGTNKIASTTIVGCTFRNLTAGIALLGSGSFTTGDFTADRSAYQIDGFTFTNNTLIDVNNQAVIPTTTSYTNLCLYLYKAFNVIYNNNKINNTSDYGIHFLHCKNVEVAKNTFSKTGYRNLASRSAIRIFNSFNLNLNNNLIADNDLTNLTVELNTCSTIKINSNTTVVTTGTPLTAVTCLNVAEHNNNIYWSGNGHCKMNNTTSGLSITSQLFACNNNYYYSGSDAFSCEYQFGTTLYRPRNQNHTDTNTFRALGDDVNSFFICSASTTQEKSDIFNRGSNSSKPFYSVLITSNAYQTGNSAFGGTTDVRNFIKQGLVDIGTYDYDAIDPGLPAPPVLVITCNRTVGINNASLFNFTANASPTQGATIQSYAWNFGDGMSSSVQNPTDIKFNTALTTVVVSCTVIDTNALSKTQNLVVNLVSNGVEVMGGYRNNEIYTGASALQVAISNIYKLNVSDTQVNALNSDVSIIIRTTTVQSLVYYNNKPNGMYFVNISTDTAFTGAKAVINNNGAAGNCLSLEGGSNVTFKNIVFTGGNPAAVRLGPAASKNIAFEDCEFRTSQYCMYIQSCDSVSFRRCLFDGATLYKLAIESSSNISLIECTFDYSLFPATESTLYPSQQCNIAIADNVLFEKCNFSGHGNWVEFLKGYGLSSFLFKGCKFSNYLGHVMWLTGGAGTYYNGSKIRFDACIFDKAHCINPSSNTVDFGAGTVVGAQSMFELNYCFDLEFVNNTIIQDRESVNMQLYWLYTTNNCSNIKCFNNLFYFKSTGTNTGVVQEYRIYRIESNTIATGFLEIYSNYNYYAFGMVSGSTLRWGSVGNTSIQNVSNAQALAGYNLDANALQIRADTLTGIINETTYEPLASSAIIAMCTGGVYGSRYDYDVNNWSGNPTAGAKEYTKTPFTFNAARFLILNKNKKAPANTTYSNTVNSVTIPSLDVLNFTNNDGFFVKSYDWRLLDATNTIIYRCLNAKFDYKFLAVPTGIVVYSVTLTMVFTDNSTQTITKTNYFNITIPRPIADYNLTKYLIYKGDSISLLNASLYASSYVWKIKNTITNVENTYNAASITSLPFPTVGNYSVELRATNAIDSDTKTFTDTLFVLDNLDVPDVSPKATRSVFLQNETIYLNANVRFRKQHQHVKWIFYNADTNQYERTSYQVNPTIPASKFPVGDYDALLIVSNPDGDVKRFIKRMFSVYPTPTKTVNINCTLTDTHVDVQGFTKDGTRIDGVTNNITPGTLIRISGSTKKLYFTNMTGTSLLPVMVVEDNNGTFDILMSGNATNGIHLWNCKHVAVLGNKNNINEKYGITVKNDPNIAIKSGIFGVKAEGFSSNVSFSGIEVSNVNFAGFQCKTEPSASDNRTWRGSGFVMDKTKIFDCYIHDVAGEGMYLGFTEYGAANSYYGAPTVPDINGNTVSFYFAHRMTNTKVYRNRVENTGWDGIQIGNSDTGCEIHDNTITKAGYLEIFGQNAGMSLNSGSSVEVYNNILDKGITCSVLDKGYFYNNVINNSINYDGFYLFTDRVPYWNYAISPNTQAYAGQWDGVTYYNNQNTKIKVFNNTVFTNRHLFVLNNRLTTKADPFSLEVMQNVVIYTLFAFSNYDATKVPVPSVGQEQNKLIRLQYVDGTFLVGKPSMTFLNNIARKVNNLADLKIINLEKLQYAILPSSTLIDAVDNSAYINKMQIPTFQNDIYDINGNKMTKKGSINNSIGAYNFTNFFIANDYLAPRTVLFKGGALADVNAYIGVQREIVVEMDNNKISVQDGVTAGGVKTVKGATGTFMIGTTMYQVENGVIIQKT